MGEKYIKNGRVYEVMGPALEDREIGTIETSSTGKWIKTVSGGYGGKVETNLTEDEIIVTDSEDGSSYILKKNPNNKYGWDYEQNKDAYETYEPDPFYTTKASQKNSRFGTYAFIIGLAIMVLLGTIISNKSDKTEKRKNINIVKTFIRNH
jgi:hypothetical protein